MPTWSRQQFLLPTWSRRQFLLPTWSRQQFLMPTWSRRQFPMPTWSRRQFLMPTWSRQQFLMPTWSLGNNFFKNKDASSVPSAISLFTDVSRSIETEVLPFPVIGSLNGVHMFGSSHNVTLQSTTTEDAKIVWKVFHDCITLIAIGQNDEADDCHMNNLLNLVFDAMVLLCGIEEITKMKNVEKFKKDVKVCFHLVDKILAVQNMGGFTQLTNTVEIIAAPENAVLQNFLDAFTETAESIYGCLLVDGKIAVATKKWWNMSAKELVLVSLLVASMTTCTSRDIPVYLPDTHPTVPHRLMTFQLTKGIEVCVICGPSPSLSELEPEVVRFWRPSYDSLRSVLKLGTRNFPTNVAVDHNTLAFLLINKETKRCLCSTSPTFDGGGPLGETLTLKQRNEVLKSFYKKMVGTFFSSVVPGSETSPSEFCHEAMESYITTDTHKCYAMMAGPHQLFVVYSDSIPTYAMRSVTQKTLSILTKDKNIIV